MKKHGSHDDGYREYTFLKRKLYVDQNAPHSHLLIFSSNQAYLVSVSFYYQILSLSQHQVPAHYMHPLLGFHHNIYLRQHPLMMNHPSEPNHRYYSAHQNKELCRNLSFLILPHTYGYMN